MDSNHVGKRKKRKLEAAQDHITGGIRTGIFAIQKSLNDNRRNSSVDSVSREPAAHLYTCQKQVRKIHRVRKVSHFPYGDIRGVNWYNVAMLYDNVDDLIIPSAVILERQSRIAAPRRFVCVIKATPI